jgi:hypothetical protein
MSTTLFFLVPIGMLAVVWSLCFVGVCFPTSGIPGTPYSKTILKEPSLIAYWPLNDLPGPAPAPPQGSTSIGIAADLSGKGHIGTYIEPPAYRSGTTVPQIGANPTVNLQQTSIVPGDGLATGSKNLPACVDFEGGYVSIPWAANSPSLTDFTLEAWIQPRWTVMGFDWVVFAARANGTGFAIYINQQNEWEFTIGNGTANPVVSTTVAAPVNPSATTYVAVTFASTNGPTGTLSLWINPASDDTSMPPTATFTTTTTYVPVDPTQQPLTFFIGAGDNQDAQTPRTQAMGLGAPLHPFQGLIQSVALYNSALNPTDLASHFEDGATSDT